MLNSALIQALGLLTPDEQQAVLTLVEYLKQQRGEAAEPSKTAVALLADLTTGDPRFATGDEELSPARRAARRFMLENPTLMRLLAQ